jgi:signal transduction histidine kinase
VVRGNAAVLLKQVNDLLDISKLDAGRMTLDYVASDLAASCGSTASHFDALAPQRDIAFAVDAPARAARRGGRAPSSSGWC